LTLVALPSTAQGIVMPRVIGRVDAAAGPTLIAVGSLHGNEPAGALALSRIFAGLGTRGRRLRGTFIGLTGNLQALARNRRYMRDDLNRVWLPERLARVRAEPGPLADEDEELRALDGELTSAIASARGPVTVFDVHCMSGQGHAFVTLDDTLSNRAVAFRIPCPCVLGLEEELRGTLTDHLVASGLVAFGFEAGQLQDPRSIDRAEAAIWVVLHALGIADGADWPEVARSQQLLRHESASLPAVVEVRHRHAVTPDEGFHMQPGFVSFQPVHRGQLLAETVHGPIAAPISGLMLMPLYQGQGNDGFFLVRPVRPVWLTLSSFLRRLPLQRFLGWLPGVSRDTADAGSFVVDTRRARWLALQVFHLLGFKRRERRAHGIVMRPRER
jgi:succinylglutamate desuccinylase